MPLSDPKCRNAKPREKAFKLFDGGGLYLEVKPIGARNPHGSKLWRLKYRHAGKETRLSFGEYPAVSLKAARAARDQARELLAAGQNPADARRRERTQQSLAAAHTFEAVAREWVEMKRAGWATSNADKVLQRLERHAFPYIGRRPIADIDAQDLLQVLQRVQALGILETAHRIKQTCGQIFRYAIATRRAKRDPAADLRGALPSHRSQHFAAPTNTTDIGALMRSLHGYRGHPATSAALRLAPMLFVRPGELRMAKWADFDLEACEWRYVTSKTNTAHLVPLPVQAVEILKDLQQLTGRSEFVFPSNRGRGRSMSANTLNAALRRMGYDTQTQITAHGFRAMARTCLAELGWDPNAIERQLAHKASGPLGAAYDRAQYLTERRRMMQAWADHLDSLARSGEKVTPLRQQSAVTA